MGKNKKLLGILFCFLYMANSFSVFAVFNPDHTAIDDSGNIVIIGGGGSSGGGSSGGGSSGGSGGTGGGSSSGGGSSGGSGGSSSGETSSGESNGGGSGTGSGGSGSGGSGNGGTGSGTTNPNDIFVPGSAPYDPAQIQRLYDDGLVYTAQDAYEAAKQEMLKAEHEIQYLDSMNVGNSSVTLKNDKGTGTLYNVFGEEFGVLISGNEEAGANAALSKTGEKLTTTTVMGDPVVISTGRFMINDLELSIPYGRDSFNITRKYSPELTEMTFGKGWFSSLDSRIIRGRSIYIEEYYDTLISLQKKAYDKSRFTSLINKVVAERNLSISNEKKNKYSYVEKYDFIDSIGTDYILYIDENENAVVLKLNSNGEYIPVNNTDKNFYIKSVGSNGENGFVVYEPDGIEKYFNEWGLLVKIKNKFNSELVLNYDSQYKISSVLENGRQFCNFTWNENGVAEINTIFGDVKKYNYENEFLTSVENEFGLEKEFSYDARNDLINFYNNGSRAVNIEWGKSSDGNYKVLKVINPLNGVESYSYNGNEVFFTDADGFSIRYTLNDKKQVVKQIDQNGYFENRTFDEKGNVVSYTDNYGSTSFVYNSNGKLIREVSSEGKTSYWNYYETTGKIKNYIDSKGNVSVFNYDKNNNLVSIYKNDVCVYEAKYNSIGLKNYERRGRNENNYNWTNNYKIAFDNNFTYEYDNRNRIVSQTDLGGKKTSYLYDGQKVSVQDYKGLKTESVYEGNLLKQVVQTDIVTGTTKIWKYEYNQNGNVTLELTGYGSSYNEAESKLYPFKTYFYTNGGSLNKYIQWNLNGINSTGVCYEFLFSGEILKKCTVYEVNRNGSKKSEDNIYDYTNDFENNLRKETIKIKGALVKTNFYDEYSNVVKSVDCENRYVENSYFGRDLLLYKNIYGGKTEYSYDGVWDNLSSSGVNGFSQEQYNYSSDGMMESYFNINGLSKSFENEFSGEMESSVCHEGKYDILTVCNEKTGESQRTVLDNRKNIVFYEKNFIDYKNRKITVENSNYSYELEFDAWKRIIFDSSKNLKYEYDIDDNVVKIIDGTKTEIINYNYLGKPLMHKTNDGNLYTYSYDVNSNLVRKIHNGRIIYVAKYDEQNHLISCTDELNMKYEYKYDGSGNVIEILKNGISVQKNNYSQDMKTLLQTDGNGNVRTSIFDDFGRVVKTKDPYGNEKIISYSQDGKYITEDFDGKKTVQFFDAVNNSLNVKYFDGSSDSVEFDCFNNITSLSSSTLSSKKLISYELGTDRSTVLSNGYKIVYDYNNGLLKNQTSDYEKLNYEYYDNGLVKSVNNSSFRCAFEYDEFGRESVRRYTNGNVISFYYDDDSRVSAIIEKDSYRTLIKALMYVYNDYNQLEWVCNEKGEIIHYEYNNNGELKTVWYPKTDEYKKIITDELNYYGEEIFESSSDILNVWQVAQRKFENIMYKTKTLISIPSSQNSISEKYSYDLCGNRIRKQTTFGTLDYTYDKMNRLTEVSGKNNVRFVYDTAGNLVLESSRDTVKQNAYYASGKLKSSSKTNVHTGLSEIHEYEYDALGRLEKIKDSQGNEMQYLYDMYSHDPFAIIPVKNTSDTSGASSGYNSSELRYLNSETYGTFMEEYGSLYSDPIKNRELSVTNESICSEPRIFARVNGKLIFSSDGTNNISYFTDAKNSVFHAKVSNSASEFFMTYSADGAESIKGFSNGIEISKDLSVALFNKMDFGFNGRQFDSVNETYNFYMRNYSPKMSSFTSQDPLYDGLNWYSYCANDPVNNVDDNGMELRNVAVAQKMQYYGDDLMLGWSDTETVKSSGCYLTTLTAVVNVLNDRNLDIYEVNSSRILFSSDPNNKGSIATNKFVTSFGLDCTTVSTAKGTPGFSPSQYAETLKEFNSSTSDSCLVVNLKLTEGNHFVTTDGTVLVSNDKAYIKVTGSSVSDNNSNSSLRTDWVFDSNNNGYAPMDNIIDIRNFERTKNCN